MFRTRKDRADHARKSGIQILPLEPIHNGRSLVFGMDYAALSQDTEMVGERRSGHFNAEHSAHLFAFLVKLPDNLQPHWISKRLKALDHLDRGPFGKIVVQVR